MDLNEYLEFCKRYELDPDDPESLAQYERYVEMQARLERMNRRSA